MCGQASEDSGELGRRFALGENHLGHALPESAMVVEFGEAQILEGQVAEALDGFVGREPLFLDLLKQLAQSF